MVTPIHEGAGRLRNTYGLDLSEFIRRRTLGVPLPPHVAEQRTRATLATALLRLGVNLNQITRHMNAGRECVTAWPRARAGLVFSDG
jgi:hypothetical protein